MAMPSKTRNSTKPCTSRTPEEAKELAATSAPIVDRSLSKANGTTANEASESPASPDPFDLDAMRAPEDFTKSGAVKRTQLKVRATPKPPRDKFLRVHSFDDTHGTEDWCLHITLFECLFEGDLSPETFLVIPNSEPYEVLFEKLKPALVVVGALRGGSKFLWELKLPTPNGNRNANGWAVTRLQIAEPAQTEWVKPIADMDAGGYQKETPADPDLFADPDWTGCEFFEMLRVAYAEKIIDSLDHPAVREHRGS